MNTHIDIISTVPTKNTEGFVTKGDTVIASVRAYKELKNTSPKWANMAQFTTATALFRIRKIPKIDITNRHIIADFDGRYNILSVDNISGRGIWLEIIAEEVV
jgi:head-tail adaptor